MKIGFCGNTNNYPFRLARALRTLGHEVLFFVDRPRSEPRHRPECHYTDVPYPYPDWIQEVPSLGLARLVVPNFWRHRIVHALNGCDGVILNGMALSLGTRLRRPKIGLLTGSDLDLYANPGLVSTLAGVTHRWDKIPGFRRLKKWFFSKFVSLQRAGIANCSLVEYAIQGLLPHGEALLNDIGVAPENRVSFMLTDLESLPQRRKRADNELHIFVATRLQWVETKAGRYASPLDQKGTDMMLEGIRRFLANTNRPLRLHLIKVGNDTGATERHVDQLGLGGHVHWLRELTQNEFLNEMAQADVVLENFGSEGGVGMGVRDALAMGVPVVAWGKSKVFERVLGEALPIYEARTPDEICARLNEIVNDPTGVERYSERARSFAARWFSTRRAAERCIAEFEKSSNNGAVG